MGTEAKGLVLMRKENGILSQELGSYSVQDGLSLVFKAYVEEDQVKLYLTTAEDVNDEEYNAIFDAYNLDQYEAEGIEVEEIDEEYNPVWCMTFVYQDEHSDNQEKIDFILDCHTNELKRVLSAIKES